MGFYFLFFLFIYIYIAYKIPKAYASEVKDMINISNNVNGGFHYYEKGLYVFCIHIFFFLVKLLWNGKMAGFTNLLRANELPAWNFLFLFFSLFLTFFSSFVLFLFCCLLYSLCSFCFSFLSIRRLIFPYIYFFHSCFSHLRQLIMSLW